MPEKFYYLDKIAQQFCYWKLWILLKLFLQIDSLANKNYSFIKKQITKTMVYKTSISLTNS